MLQVAAINEAVASIAASSQQQAGALGEVNTAMLEADQLTQETVRIVAQSATAAGSLVCKSEDLHELIAQFHIGAAAPIVKSGWRLSAKLSPAPDGMGETGHK